MHKIVNTFHNTEYRTTLTPDQWHERCELAERASGERYENRTEEEDNALRWAHKVKRALCGRRENGCVCSTFIGERN